MAQDSKNKFYTDQLKSTTHALEAILDEQTRKRLVAFENRQEADERERIDRLAAGLRKSTSSTSGD